MAFFTHRSLDDLRAAFVEAVVLAARIGLDFVDIKQCQMTGALSSTSFSCRPRFARETL